MKRDVIIIGTGVAGMTAGVTLAKEGLGVLALEQSPQPGGLMRRFARAGLSFPTGVHSVGSLDAGQTLWRCFKYMGVLGRVDLVRMNADGFVEYSFPGWSFRVPIGHEAFRARLIERFPSERKAVDAFFSDLQNTTAHFPLHTIEVRPMRPLDETQRGSLQDYLDSLTACSELKLVLSASNFFYGMSPSECPLYVHLLVLDSFLNGAWRVDERRVLLAAAFEEQLKSLGGEIRCNARVVSIDSTNGEIRGVSLANGERLEAPRVIYTGHPRLLSSLCADRAMRPAFRERVRDLPETPGLLGVAIDWRGADCPVGLTDSFLFQSADVHRPYEQRLLDDRAMPHLVYCAASPAGSSRTRAAVALSPSPVEEWSRWAETRTGQRPADYGDIKARLAERTLGTVKARWPEEAAHLTAVDTFTPLTFRDYTLTPTGSAYGLKKSVAAGPSGRIAHDTRIKGLSLAGQSVLLPGVVGTTISSIAACARILGERYLVERIARETE